MKRYQTGLLFLTFLLCCNFLFAQDLTQTIRGKVYDSETQIGLPGATIVIVGSNPLKGTITDVEGYFKLKEVSVGRIDLQVSFLGYENQYISDILVSSGKEIVLEVALKEAFTKLSEVVVKPDIEKEDALNTMATLSARTFSVEEAQRFAGGMDDPSRLAASFAGVTPNTVDNNEIVIRGNAAKGILWRLEGVEIPPPNHLAGLFSGGGINTMFNSNILSNSDFFTGAFPAEYGNAMSGVFDINLRNGNSDKREYAFQIGTYGIDVAAEGPFKKGKRASYLINYRYSTYGLLENLLPQVTGLPQYQDLSLKFVFPAKRAGIFSLWSINGMSSIDYNPEKDTTKWETNMDSYEYDIKYNLTSSGINHRKVLGKKSYLFSSVSFSATEYVNNNSYYRYDLTKVPVNNQDEINSSISLLSYLNYKFNSRHTNRTGFVISRRDYNYDVEANTNVAENDNVDFFVKSKGNTITAQLYSQSKFYLTEDLIINAGLHLEYFNFNKEFIPEPRLGITWQYKPGHSISIAYGSHSKMEPLRIYLSEVPVSAGAELLNKDLKITKAHHLVIGYDRKLNLNTHLRIEAYYQKLLNVPVTADSSFSMINYNNEMFFNNQLFSTGTGSNMGLDITLERFLNKGFYYMFTASVYDSKYKGGDGVERNSRYNQNFVLNILAGKEWQTNKSNTFGINGKFTILGGKRYSPVDYEKSNTYKYVVYDDSRIYEEQSPTNYYLDMSLNYTINKAKFSQSIILQLKNLLLQNEFLGYAYNYDANSVKPYELTLIFPYLSYKIQF